MKNIKTILILPSLLLLTSGYAEALFGFTEISDAYVGVDTTAQVLPKAEPNDQRKPAGRMVNGELKVNLEAVEAEWYPRGPEGPRIITPAFSEAGRSPHVGWTTNWAKGIYECGGNCSNCSKQHFNCITYCWYYCRCFGRSNVFNS